MYSRKLCIFVFTLYGASLLAAAQARPQNESKRSPEQLKALYTAHKADFDYLLGDWEFTSESQEYGKFGGRWSAVRLETGQILDEYRVIGDDGNTIYVTSTIRAYDAASDRWELIGMSSGNGLQDFGAGQRINGENTYRTEVRYSRRQVHNLANQILQHSTRPFFVDGRSFCGRRPNLGEELSADRGAPDWSSARFRFADDAKEAVVSESNWELTRHEVTSKIL